MLAPGAADQPRGEQSTEEIHLVDYICSGYQNAMNSNPTSKTNTSEQEQQQDNKPSNEKRNDKSNNMNKKTTTRGTGDPSQATAGGVAAAGEGASEGSRDMS